MTSPTSHANGMGVRVLIVDDHGLLAQTLTLALRAEGLAVEHCTETSAEAITAAVDTSSPDLVLLDLDIGGELGSSLSLIAPLTEREAGVVMLTGVTDRLRLAQCVQAGAVGIIAKSEPFETLIEDVKRALDDGTLVTPGQREEHLAELRRHDAESRQRFELFDQLTPREAEMLAALMEGKHADEIASEWVVAMSTVRTLIRNLLQKLGVNSQLAAVVMAQKAGWPLDGA